jgi:hypothetical protein
LFSADFFLYSPDSPWFHEAVLQVIWNEQLIEPKPKTIDGRTVEVLFPGVWNVGAGPDFQDAAIRIDGELKRGPVELHLRPSAWDQHGHQHDSEYDEVILHVVWHNPDGRATHPPGVPLLTVEPVVTTDVNRLIGNVDVGNYPYASKVRPGSGARHLAELSDAQVTHLLVSYGLSRLARRAGELAVSITRDGLEATAYVALADGMGYRSNRQPFRELAALVPLETLRSLLPAEREAALFGTAGLLPDPTQTQLLPEWRSWVEDRWRLWWPRRTGYKIISWSRRRQRPQNRAERRLLGLCKLLARTNCRAGVAIIEATMEESAPRLVQKRLLHLLSVPGDADERRLSDFTAKLGQPAALVGEARARELIINVALPLALAQSLLENKPADGQRIRDLAAGLPKLAGNRRFEEAGHCLLTPPSRIKTVVTCAAAQLGLLELYERFYRPSEDE